MYKQAVTDRGRVVVVFLIVIIGIRVKVKTASVA
jgi:hypothetical protein